MESLIEFDTFVINDGFMVLCALVKMGGEEVLGIWLRIPSQSCVLFAFAVRGADNL